MEFTKKYRRHIGEEEDDIFNKVYLSGSSDCKSIDSFSENGEDTDKIDTSPQREVVEVVEVKKKSSSFDDLEKNDRNEDYIPQNTDTDKCLIINENRSFKNKKNARHNNRYMNNKEYSNSVYHDRNHYSISKASTFNQKTRIKYVPEYFQHEDRNPYDHDENDEVSRPTRPFYFRADETAEYNSVNNHAQASRLSDSENDDRWVHDKYEEIESGNKTALYYNTRNCNKKKKNYFERSKN